MNIFPRPQKLTIEQIARIPFFNDLKDEYLVELAEVMTLHRFEANKYVFKEGDDQNSIYFIIEGSVKVLKNSKDDQEELLAELKTPQIFGEMALISHGRRSASVITSTELVVAELTYYSFEKLINSKPKLAVNIIKKIANTLNTRLKQINTAYINTIY